MKHSLTSVTSVLLWLSSCFSACLAVSLFLVVPIPYVTVRYTAFHFPLCHSTSHRGVSVWHLRHSVKSHFGKGRASWQLVFQINYDLSKECPALYRSSQRSPAQWSWYILICTLIRYTVCLLLCCCFCASLITDSCVPPVGGTSESLLLF